MRDTLRDTFATLLAGEPPMRVSAEQIRRQGRHRRHRRVAAIAAGSAVSIGVGSGAAVAYDPGAGLPAAMTGPSGSPAVVPTTPVQSATPTISRRITPPTRYEIPRCSGDGSAKNLTDTDGSVLPDPQTAAQAVLAHAATIAPGRTFAVVTAAREDSSAKYPNAPRVNLIFDVTDEVGTGSLNVELIPQAGMSASDRAAIDLHARPFSNCTDATLVEFPDGAAGLEYPVALGTGRPDDSVQHTSYYGPTMDINAGAFLNAWDDPTGSRGARTSMPLTTGEVLAICRLVALT
jgi:hypothetical protein